MEISTKVLLRIRNVSELKQMIQENNTKIITHLKWWPLYENAY